MTIMDLPCCNGSTLRKATRRVTQLYDATLSPCGLTISQFSILVAIHAASNPTMSDLAHALVLDRSALAHNLRPLVRDGYVAQTKNETDGRSRRIALTAPGLVKLDEATALWKRAQARFETAYGYEESKQLRASLTIIFSDGFTTLFNAATVG